MSFRRWSFGCSCGSRWVCSTEVRPRIPWKQKKEKDRKGNTMAIFSIWSRGKSLKVTTAWKRDDRRREFSIRHWRSLFPCSRSHYPIGHPPARITQKKQLWVCSVWRWSEDLPSFHTSGQHPKETWRRIGRKALLGYNTHGDFIAQIDNITTLFFVLDIRISGRENEDVTPTFLSNALSLASRAGLDSQECMLRSVCEANQHPERFSTFLVLPVHLLTM